MKFIRLIVFFGVLVSTTSFASGDDGFNCDKGSKKTAALTYILDTNVLLHEPNAFLAFKDGETVVLPAQVITEMEKKKTHPELGMAAREFFRLFDFHTHGQPLNEGVRLSNGSSLKVASFKRPKGRPSDLIASLDLTPGSNPDNLILATMIQYRSQHASENIMFLSGDNAFRIQARVYDFQVGKFNEKYDTAVPVSDEELVYSGLKKYILSETDYQEFKAHGSNFKVNDPKGFYDNQFVMVKDQELSKIDKNLDWSPENTRIQSLPVIARYRASDQTLNRLKIKKTSKVQGIVPQNVEQVLAFDLLLDPMITTVTLFGKAGSGKTLLTMAAGLEQKEAGKYDKILYAKAYEHVGGKDKHGFLKGTYDEKTGPYHESFVDNLETIYGFDRVQAARKKTGDHTNNILREFGMDPMKITFSRGRSVDNAFIIIDEAQNLTAAELKTLGTRVGKGSKLVLMGDLKQIDLAGVRGASGSAFFKVVNTERFKNSDLSGHIMLVGGLRSRTADLFSDIFDEIEGILTK